MNPHSGTRDSVAARSVGPLNRVPKFSRLHPLLVLALWLSFRATATPDYDPSVRLEIVRPPEGTVLLEREGFDAPASIAAPALLQTGDQLSTPRRIRAEIRFAGRFILLDEQSSLILRATQPVPVIEVLSGRFWCRSALAGQPLVVTHRTGARMEPIGTEFAIDAGDASDTNRFEVTLIDGKARLIRLGTTRDVGPMSQGRLNQGQWTIQPMDPDATRASILVHREIQWALHYPVILDPGDVADPPTPDPGFRSSLEAYRSGDLPTAIRRYPVDADSGELQAATHPVQSIYRAAILLLQARVEDAEKALRPFDADPAASQEPSSEDRIAHALRLIIAAVHGDTIPRPWEPRLASEWLAESYYQQSRSHALRDTNPPVWESLHYDPGHSPLRRARTAARNAVAASAARGQPASPIAQVRLAELEFSFGDLPSTRAALKPALAALPRYAPAHVLDGFTLAASERNADALDAFQRALDLDPGLGDAWLGRGLCRYHKGQTTLGLADLEQAVAAEPNRSSHRAYLAKGYLDAYSAPASKIASELDIARRLDPGDPSTYLYSALLLHRQNRVLESIRDLETSISLNENRAVYRSSHLLDQDRAVRGANLAALYDDAGMPDIGARVASHAVADDYASHSAHLFLAQSYNNLRDVRGTNLRYEAPAYSEFLIANLLAPPGVGILSPSVSYGEYSPLFEQDGLHLNNVTTWTSNGDWSQDFAQYGSFGGTDYAVEGLYRSLTGERPNQDLEQSAARILARQRLGPSDTVIVRAEFSESKSGDLSQYFDPSQANLSFRAQERQSPFLLAGLRHDWNPDAQTLIAGTWVDAKSDAVNGAFPPVFVALDPAGVPVEQTRAHDPFPPLVQTIESSYWTAEIQHLQAIGDAHQLLAGTRIQGGDLGNEGSIGASNPAYPSGTNGAPFVPAGVYQFHGPVSRGSFYLYDRWEFLTRFQAVAGIAYDTWTHPRNVVNLPIEGRESSGAEWSPKAGLHWRDEAEFHVQAGYAAGVTGFSFEQSLRLEPTEVAGVLQTFRSLIPEAIAGFVPDQDIETFGLALSKSWNHRTHVLLEATRSESEATAFTGAYLTQRRGRVISVTQADLPHRLSYEEWRLNTSIHHAVSSQLGLGLRYQLTDARLDDDLLRGVPGDPSTPAWDGRQDSLLHQIEGGIWFHHPSGFFASAKARWWRQFNGGDAQDLTDAGFGQFDLFAGWHLLQRRATITVGLLNLTGDDYRLHPLVYYQEPYRERTLLVNLSFRL